MIWTLKIKRQAIHCSEVMLDCTYSLCAGVLAGHMEADHFLSHDDIRDTVAIVSHLAQKQNTNTVNK